MFYIAVMAAIQLVAVVKVLSVLKQVWSNRKKLAEFAKKLKPVFIVDTSKGWQFRRYLAPMFAILFIICMFCKHCSDKGGQVAEAPKYLVSTDTLWLPQDTIVVYDTTWLTSEVIRWRTAPAPVPAVIDTGQMLIAEWVTEWLEDEENIYIDTIIGDSVTLYYAALVEGQLLDMRVGYTLNFPVITPSTTITKTRRVTNKVFISGLFLTGSIGGSKDAAQAGVGLTYVSRRRWMLGYEYRPTYTREGFLSIHAVQAGVRLWGRTK